MANYPNAVTTFTTKSDGAGNTIQAAHINDLQNEVTAIEDGLLNGTAPVNSSRITAPASQITASTVTNLTVTGNSTLGAINGGASTFTSLVVTTPADAVRAYNSAAVAVADNTRTVVSFDSHRFTAGNSLHSTATTPSRFIPASSGWYAISGHVTWNSNSSGQRLIELLVNSTTRIAVQSAVASATAPFAQMSVATTYNLSTSDYVELRVYQGSGSTGSVQVIAGESPELSFVKLR